MTRVQVVDPSAYTLPYDHSLCTALARAGAEVELITSSFAYGAAPAAEGYVVRELFYRRARGAAGSRTRRVTKLLEHAPDMLRLRRRSAAADVVHFQWLPVQWLDRHLLPSRPVVLTAHDLLPREPRPLQAAAQRRLYDAVEAVVVHSDYGRQQLVHQLGISERKVHVIHHGAFEYLEKVPGQLPPELVDCRSGHAGAASESGRQIVLFFGLWRPYKGLDVLLRAWRELKEQSAELWIVGRPRMAVEPLAELAVAGVHFVPRFVSDAELAACFRQADLLVLPYTRTERFDFSGVLATSLAFGTPAVLSDVGGFGEVAATGAARLVPPEDPSALAAALGELLRDATGRTQMAAAARAAAAGPYSWEEAARRTIALYLDLLA